MFLRNKKGKVRSKKSAPTSYVASQMDFVLGIDFELYDDPLQDCVCVKLLKGKYEGVKYRYNSLGVKEDPAKSKADSLMMTMDYKVLDYGKLSKEIEKEEEFNNTVFNVVYALIMLQQNASSKEEVDENDS
jgi:hypothetical protein